MSHTRPCSTITEIMSSFIYSYSGGSRGGSGVSLESPAPPPFSGAHPEFLEKEVNMYKGVGVRFGDFISVFLIIP